MKKLKNILFFCLMILVILVLLDILGVISFIKGVFITFIPLFIGFFISICMETIIGRLVNKGYKRSIVTIISYIGLLLLLVLLFIIFIPPFINQIQIFIDTLPSLLEQINSLLLKFNINMNSTSILDILQIKTNEIMGYFSNSFSLFFSIGIAISSAFFISYDYGQVKEKVKNAIPEIIKEEVIYFFSKYVPFFSKYIYSLLIDSLITFVISFTLFTIFKVEYSLIGAIIITITNLIPFIGPLLGIVPLVVIGYSVSNYFAIISLVIVVIVQLVESNIIQPLIFKNVIKLHPLEGIIGVLVFSYLFSTIGMILSPLLVVAFKILFIEKYNKAEVTL